MGCERESTWVPMSWRMSGDKLAAMERAGLILAMATPLKAIA